MGKKTVLIADDEPGMLHSLGLCLKDEFNVLKAESGVEAWQIIKRLHIDCLVTDIRMPHMGGLELLKKVRKEGFDMKVILSSGYMDDIEEEMILSLNVDYCLQKPYSPIRLIEMLRAC